MNSWLRNTISKLYNVVSAPVAATREAVASRLQSVRDTVTLLYDKTKEKLGYGQTETLKDIVENEADKEHLDEIQYLEDERQQDERQDETQQDEQQEEEDVDLTPRQHLRALKGAYRSFRSAGLAKVDVDTYIERIKPYIKTLIEQQIKELGSAKVQLSMWIKWKKEKNLHFSWIQKRWKMHRILVTWRKNISMQKSHSIAR